MTDAPAEPTLATYCRSRAHIYWEREAHAAERKSRTAEIRSKKEALRSAMLLHGVTRVGARDGGTVELRAPTLACPGTDDVRAHLTALTREQLTGDGGDDSVPRRVSRLLHDSIARRADAARDVSTWKIAVRTTRGGGDATASDALTPQAVDLVETVQMHQKSLRQSRERTKTHAAALKPVERSTMDVLARQGCTVVHLRSSDATTTTTAGEPSRTRDTFVLRCKQQQRKPRVTLRHLLEIVEEEATALDDGWAQDLPDWLSRLADAVQRRVDAASAPKSTSRIVFERSSDAT